MPSQGPNSVSTGVSSGPGVAWSNPSNVTQAGSKAADVVLPVGSHSAWLVSLGANFSAIPDDATITGVLVEWRTAGMGPGVLRPKASRLVVGGVIGTTDRLFTWPLSYNYRQAGGATDTWGVALTVADVKAAGFGAAVVAEEYSGDGGQTTAYVDDCRITVFYTVP